MNQTTIALLGLSALVATAHAQTTTLYFRSGAACGHIAWSNTVVSGLPGMAGEPACDQQFLEYPAGTSGIDISFTTSIVLASPAYKTGSQSFTGTVTITGANGSSTSYPFTGTFAVVPGSSSVSWTISGTFGEGGTSGTLVRSVGWYRSQQGRGGSSWQATDWYTTVDLTTP